MHIFGPSSFFPFFLLIAIQVKAKELANRRELLKSKWGYDWPFSGISTFGHLPHTRCLIEPEEEFDIAIIGVPFDSACSYRPGARMGPRAIRAASNRHLVSRGFNVKAGLNPYTTAIKVIDCGDVPVTPLQNELALEQMTEALTELALRKTKRNEPPGLVILGGDHSVALPALRALSAAYKTQLSLLHFDAHLDTLDPNSYPSAEGTEGTTFNHGSMFWMAAKEGLIRADGVHAGLRTRLTGDDWADYEEDDRQGFMRIMTDDVDTIGTSGIIKRILERLDDDRPVYLSIDIDVLDPAFAGGTGAPEPGGWTSRELLQIIRGLGELNIVGMDIVEVAPAYDSAGGDTSLIAAQLGYEIITHMVKKRIREKVSDSSVWTPVSLN